jgi:hypothetical protein
MESMNLLDITIKYFNVIVFVLCVIFGITSFFASWIAWREIQKKHSILRSIVAAYNIAEDALEKGGAGRGDFDLDPSIVQTVFNTLQEVLNAMYGEVTGRPIPPIEERVHGSKKSAVLSRMATAFKRKKSEEKINIDSSAPNLRPTEKDHHQSLHT